MTKSTATAFATFATSFIGRLVEVGAANDKQTFMIAKLDADKIGSLKDGSKGEYVVLQSTADEAVLIALHPQKAKSLLSKGEFDGMTLLADVAEPVEATPEKKAKKEKKAKADVAVEPKEPKEPSKKDLFMDVYRAGVAAGKSRKDIKADCAVLGLSDAGFNTYYQNCRSGKWI